MKEHSKVKAAGFKLVFRTKPKLSKGDEWLANFQRERLPYVCSRNEVFLTELRRKTSSRQARVKPTCSYRHVVYQAFSPVDRSKKSLKYALNHYWELPKQADELVQRLPSLEPKSPCRRCLHRSPLRKQTKPEMVDEYSEID